MIVKRTRVKDGRYAYSTPGVSVQLKGQPTHEYETFEVTVAEFKQLIQGTHEIVDGVVVAKL